MLLGASALSITGSYGQALPEFLWIRDSRSFTPFRQASSRPAKCRSWKEAEPPSAGAVRLDETRKPL